MTSKFIKFFTLIAVIIADVGLVLAADALVNHHIL